ncbi:hypothetical protein GPUN_0571 [Glaciecola punicea ACAM 611]|uniref:Uncharacterized protein n=1 Tax=Glaciecola punicea ACAM 611 TaxID=1121923 RepID=H5T8T8_9ALTE|nr:hypothetical protein GPUN_0571 [Glaciecola punicea ACAM 611]
MALRINWQCLFSQGNAFLWIGPHINEVFLRQSKGKEFLIA